MSEKVIADSLAQLQKRSSSKWRFYPSDILPLPVAEMDFQIAEGTGAIMSFKVQISYHYFDYLANV
jgi:cystathionine beta-lyase